jgi:sugar phosphate isomerase/epimerase
MKTPANLPSYQFGISEFTTQPWTFDQDVENYARLGVQAIEVCEAKLDMGRAEAQMRLVTSQGLSVSSVQPKTRTLFPSQSQPKPAVIGERLACFRQTIEALAPWTPGVPFVTNTGIAPDGNIQAAIDTAVWEYRDLADFAAFHGVRIALEPLNAAIMNIESAIWTLPQAMQIVEAVDRDNFGICLDFWNVWQNADIEEHIRGCGNKIFLVQASDWRAPHSFQDRLVPGGGEIPLPSLLRAAHDGGYRGPYIVEIFSADVSDSLWEGDLDQVIQDSRTGLDAAWGLAFTEPLAAYGKG